jgi:hypothetical protein
MLMRMGLTHEPKTNTLQKAAPGGRAAAKILLNFEEYFYRNINTS